MNQRQLKKWMKKEMEAVVNQIGDKLEVVGNKRDWYPMYYKKKTHATNQIGFNPKLFKNVYCNKVRSSDVTFKESIIIGVLHEIGHHRDKEYKQKHEERKKHYKNWKYLNTPKGLDSTPGWRAMKDIEALPHMLKQWQLTYEIECWAWELASVMNQQYKFVSQTSFVASKTYYLSTYSKLLFEVIDAYQTLKNEHVRTA